MKGAHYLTRPGDFARVHEQGKWVGGGPVGVKNCPNSLPIVRYGFIVSRRVGKAVTRNLIKRRLREIMRQVNVKAGTDIIVSARPKASVTSFAMLRDAVYKALGNAGLLIRNDKENCSVDD